CSCKLVRRRRCLEDSVSSTGDYRPFLVDHNGADGNRPRAERLPGKPKRLAPRPVESGPCLDGRHSGTIWTRGSGLRSVGDDPHSRSRSSGSGTSSNDSRTRSASSSAKAAVIGFGTATQKSPAALAARTPFKESATLGFGKVVLDPGPEILEIAEFVLARAQPLRHALAVERPADEFFEVLVRVEGGADRADERRPLVERQLVAVFAVELLVGEA